MEIVKFEQVEQLLKTLLRSFSLIPVIGSGFSSGSLTAKGGKVPNGKIMRQDMLDAIKEYNDNIDQIENDSFSNIATYYNAIVPVDEQRNYLSKNFVRVSLSKEKTNFLQVEWPYIYTLNIDDAIENSGLYKTILSNREFYLDILDDNEKYVLKLHGDAREMTVYKDGGKHAILSLSQYVDSLKHNEQLLNKLKQDCLDKNLIFIGCSLDDEIDLLSVFRDAQSVKSSKKVDRFFITETTPNDFQKIKLSNMGITKVIVVGSFDYFYEHFTQIAQQINSIEINELKSLKNLPSIIKNVHDENNEDYILFGKTPFSKKTHKIELPYFFITRNISKNILQDFDKYALQIVVGQRISGKSYILLDLQQSIKNREVYYFDSRECVNRNTLTNLLEKENCVVLLDTAVLSNSVFEFLLRYDLSLLSARRCKVVICVNSNDRNYAEELKKNYDNEFLKVYLISNKLSETEYVSIKKKLASCNIPIFERNKTIIDNIIDIQKQLIKGKDLFKNFQVKSDEYLQIVVLLLLAHKGKLTVEDITRFSIMSDLRTLMPKLDKIAEDDFRYLYAPSVNNASYQIVCNAQAWLITYLSKIALNESYFESITKAYVYIAEKMKNVPIHKNNKELMDFINFNNINFLLGSARIQKHQSGAKRLIQNIYTKLKPLLNDDFQFHHQHAKCLLWGVERLSSEEERKSTLEESHKAIIIARQLVCERLNDRPNNAKLKITLAHIEFTLTMVCVKQFYFSKNIVNFENAVVQLNLILNNKLNLSAEELQEELRKDNEDYSISQFILYLMTDDSNQYKTAQLKNLINNVLTRYKYVVNYSFC